MKIGDDSVDGRYAVTDSVDEVVSWERNAH